MQEALRALRSGRAASAAARVLGSGSGCDCRRDTGPRGELRIPGLTDEGDALIRARNPKEVALWKGHMARRRPVIKKYHSKITAALFKARAEVLTKLSKADPSQFSASSAPSAVNPSSRAAASLGAPKPAQRAAAADFLFDLVRLQESLTVELRPTALNALIKAGQEMFDEVEHDDPFTMPPAEALEFMQARENKLSEVASDVWSEVNRELQEGITEGESIKELSDRVRGQFNDMAKGRAERIAMTETAAAYGYARQKAMEDAGVPFKKWLSSGLDNVRPAHQEANGQIVAIDQDYIVGREAIAHPGDPRGSAGNVINCHCVSVASPVGPAADPSTPSEDATS